MKRLIILTCIAFTLSTFAQNKKGLEYFPLIGEKAPSFKTQSTQGNLNFPKDQGKSWKVLLSHPADFTPVCTSELLELSHSAKDFDNMNTKIVILSTDNLERHNLWVKSIEELTYKGVSNTKVTFPLCTDTDYKISRSYGMIHPNVNSTRNVRGVFIIDPENTIRAIMYYPMETGRNTEEIKRTVLALQKSDAEKVLTPASWKPGEDLIVPFANKSVEPNMNSKDDNYNAIDDPSVYAVSWYFKLRPDTYVSLKDK